MNFEKFYRNTEQRLTDSILSLWATGDAEMQKYLKYIFQNEKLLAEPVFQNTFPWEPHSIAFGKLKSIFTEQRFIEALDKVKPPEYKFPKTQIPYKHQVESWQTLINDKNSIIVTTGTGSGKTECFMLPVLYDIYKRLLETKNEEDKPGVNAIFLYPLNALISSQQKRMDAWTKSLGEIKYAIYNGNTPEQIKKEARPDNNPLVNARKDIRENPPHILFTNPTMLEYILVRDKDSELLEKSQGKLRWILLDEAHTLTGSTATEMAMLIRRVINAFGVKAEDVRFAATSATVGIDSEKELLSFMSGLSGLPESKIKVITGKRILPEIPSEDSRLVKCSYDNIKSSIPEDLVKFPEIHSLRKEIIEKNALEVSKIGKLFGVKDIYDQINLVDRLSETSYDDVQLFPVRGHFFTRGIGGVFVCSNPACDKHGENKPKNTIGAITTIAGTQCTHCKSPLLELVACRSCGKYMLLGEQYTAKIDDRDKEFIKLSSTVSQEAFLFESEDIEDEENQQQIDNFGKKRFLVKNSGNERLVDMNLQFLLSLEESGEIITGGRDYIYARNDKDESICPHCGEKTNNPMHFRISSGFTNRVLSDIILEQTPQAQTQTTTMLWNGHKYISFTDSRQGTAKMSANINADNERNWLRNQVFHTLAKKRMPAQPARGNTEIDADILCWQNKLETNEDIDLIEIIKEKLTNFNNEKQKAQIPPVSESCTSWGNLSDELVTRRELQTLKKNIGGNAEDKDFLASLFYNQFARRLPRERSLENLGLISIVYPQLYNSSRPGIATKLQISEQEWQSLLKISVDYILRYYFHFTLNNTVRKLSTSFLRSQPIYSYNSPLSDIKKWPLITLNNGSPTLRQNRLSLLICAGLGIHSHKDLNKTYIDNINMLLAEIWDILRIKLLGNPESDNNDYRLNLEKVFHFELTDKLWLCPAKNRLIDRHFKGYSPWISGNLTEENISHFKVGDEIEFPYFPFPYYRDKDGELDKDPIKIWIEKECKHLKEKGVWNDLHEGIFLNNPVFLAGEHSAQQNDSRLKELEKKFEEGTINILSCSTTMEMGVDIGGISAVVMNNVPPSPANYLQRAGRAGRRKEDKSLSLTFCAANPIGSNVIHNPMWALSHKIAPPMLSFNSPMVIERHFNAFLLGEFIRNKDGINIKETIDGFFFSGDSTPMAQMFCDWVTSDIPAGITNGFNNLKKETPFHNDPTSVLQSLVQRNFEIILKATQSKKKGFEETLTKLRPTPQSPITPAYKAVAYQRRQFMLKPLLAYLVDEGFLPSAGIPTGIIDFDTISIEDLQEIEKIDKERDKKDYLIKRPSPSFHVTRALTEFAPGNNIIIDGWNYISAGITLKSQWGESKKDTIQSCSKCGFQRILRVEKNENPKEKCPVCEEETLYGLILADGTVGRYTEFIEPSGFAIDLYKPRTRIIPETSNSQYTEPLLIGVQPWSDNTSSIYDIRQSIENAEILFYNMGKGNGYSVCLHCGRTAFDKKELDGHRRLRGGKRDDGKDLCSGNDTNGYGIHHNVMLSGRFKTDFCEIRFRDELNKFTDNEDTIRSLGVILTKTLAIHLGIEEKELSFGIKRYNGYRSLFIFDTAKGGAGYSIKFSYFAKEIFEESLIKLKKCNCDSACTKCLIDRTTQWFINKLDRNKAINWLERVEKLTVPEALLTKIPTLRPIVGSIKEDINRLKYRNDISDIWFFIDNKVVKWYLEDSHFIKDFKKKFDKINFVVSDDLNFGDKKQNIITALQMQGWSEFWKFQTQDSVLKPVCQVQLKDGHFITYYAINFQNSLDENWGNSDSPCYLDYSEETSLKLSNITVELPPNANNIFQFKIIDTSVFDSSKLADKLIVKIAEQKIDLESRMNGKTFKVEYSDSYIKSPLSCLLLVRFIERLKEIYKFNIKSINIKSIIFDERYKISELNCIHNNYTNSISRDEELKRLAQHNFHNINFTIESLERGSLTHYRTFTFTDDTTNAKIIIQPDAGIEHGWHTKRPIPYRILNGPENFEIRKGIWYPILYFMIIE